jgi:RNA polymerase sigma-70 factor (ECF subfamily)
LIHIFKAILLQIKTPVNTHHKNDNDLKQELLEITQAKNNPAKFDVLYERYYKSIFVFIYRRTGDEELTADIASHVFLKALINIKKYEYRGVPFSAWLFRIAFNEINMYFRKSNAQRVVSIEKAGVVQIAEEVEQNDTVEAQQKMMLALKSLEQTDIQLIELRFFEKRSFAEIGEIVGITENNAKVKVYRILDKLKKLLTNPR